MASISHGKLCGEYGSEDWRSILAGGDLTPGDPGVKKPSLGMEGDVTHWE